MEIKNLIFQTLERYGIQLSVLQSHAKLKFCLIDKLMQMTRQGQCKIERSNSAAQTASVEPFKVKKYFKTRKLFEFLKLTAKPKVLENLKRSRKKSTNPALVISLLVQVSHSETLRENSHFSLAIRDLLILAGKRLIGLSMDSRQSCSQSPCYPYQKIATPPHWKGALEKDHECPYMK